MLDRAFVGRLVEEANQAPSIHNAQPARWRLRDNTLEIAADLAVTLPAADPDGRGVALSCGAALEATVLVCAARGYHAEVVECWDENDCTSWPGHRLAARLVLTQGGQPDRLYDQLSQRFTWRSSFTDETPRLFGWSRQDTHLVLDTPTRRWLAEANDIASLIILNDAAFRRELLSWVRLAPAHPRWAHDGLSRAALLMPKTVARKFRLGFGPLWPLLRLVGATTSMTAERDVTMTAPVIAAFHVPHTASDVAAGRAYLRMWLEASNLGFAAWPMAALTDHAPTQVQVAKRLNIGQDRRLIQVLRFGKPTGVRPARARRPLSEIFYD